MDRDRRWAVITSVAGTVFIAAGAFWLSFTALVDLAARSGVGAGQAWAWPLIVDGIIQSGASSYSSQSGGAASAYAGAGASSNGGTTIGGSTAIGNQLNVVVQGSRNTVIVNSTQTNTGAINAGTALNGNINLP